MVRFSIVAAFLVALPAVAYLCVLLAVRSGDQAEPDRFQSAPLDGRIVQIPAAPNDVTVLPSTDPNDVIVMTPTGEIIELQPGDGWDIPPGDEWELHPHDEWHQPDAFPEPEPVEIDEFGEVDYEVAARASIGAELYEDIKSRTSLTIVDGDTGPYSARASYEWTNDGAPGVAVITVSRTGNRAQFHDLIAHELAHVAVYSMGLITEPDQECLADIIASHWRRDAVTNGDYDYVTCEWSETALLVIDEFG